MERIIPGIHHITAIASDPQQNSDFYTGLLGLRLVKLTVNFDDPGSYHLYYGDELGHPGTILTFFAWPGAPKGRLGPGQINTVAFSIAPDSLNYWLERLQEKGIAARGPEPRFDEQVLSFADPDGLALELVARPGTPLREGWNNGDIPAEHALRGFAGVTITTSAAEDTATLLTRTMGFHASDPQQGRARYTIGADAASAAVDLVNAVEGPRGRIAAGSVHHIAWRTPSDEEELAWREQLLGLGYQVTPVRDRQYFHSIYYHEPGGVLFEIATDPPGFATDETPATLGTHLKLPPWLEPQRAQIERALPPLRLPAAR